MEKITIHPSVVLRHPSLASNLPTEKQSVLNFFQTHKGREILYTSSPSLFKEYLRWENGELNEAQKEKMILSLYKYRLRMAFRPTPFGLHSSLTAVNINEIPKGFSIDRVNRRTQLDSSVMLKLIEKIEGLDSVKYQLKFRLNSSIYRLEKSYRYFQVKLADVGELKEIKSINANPLIDQIVDKCKEFTNCREVLKLISNFSSDENEQKSYFNSLVSAQFLHSELNLCLSEDDQLDRIIKVLKRIQASTKSSNSELDALSGMLIRLQVRLIRIDKRPTNRISALKALIRQLKEMDIELSEKYFIQIDQKSSLKPGHESIENLAISQCEIAPLLNFLNLVSGDRKNKNLETFKKQFRRRYGENQISLLRLMDPHLEMGYGTHNHQQFPYSVILNDLQLNYGNQKGSPIKPELSEDMNTKILNAIKSDQREVYIDPVEFKSSSDRYQGALPNSFSLSTKMIQLDDGSVGYLIKNVGGNHAIHYISRFCHHKEILKLAKSISKHESDCATGKELVEFYHRSQSRACNIARRPKLYDRSAHYLDNPSTEKDVLTIENFSLSLIENEFLLYHTDCEKPIQPKISSAQDHRINTFPLHHFLGDLQSQHFKTDLNFDWGSWEDQFQYLPRIRFGKFIVKPAQWTFSTQNIISEIKELGPMKWRRKWRLPETVSIIEGDQEIPVILDCDLGISLLHDFSKRQSKLKLIECINCYSNFLKDEKDRTYEHELIYSILNHSNRTIIPFCKSITNGKEFQLRHDSKWIYLKLYTNASLTEKLLPELSSLISSLQRSSQIDKWFFIRYRDPDHHLRLRLQLADSRCAGKVMNEVRVTAFDLKRKSLIWKFQFDNYQAEIKRYGKECLHLSETIFHYDSEAIMRFYLSFPPSHFEDFQWQIGILLLNDLFEQFGLKVTDRINFLKESCSAFKLEYQYGITTKRSLARQFRSKRKRIIQLLTDGNEENDESKMLKGIAAERSLKIKPTIQKLKAFREADRLNVNWLSLLDSHLHMTANRIFPTAPRVHEFVLYDLLCKHYESKVGRKNQRSKMKVQ